MASLEEILIPFPSLQKGWPPVTRASCFLNQLFYRENKKYSQVWNLGKYDKNSLG